MTENLNTNSSWFSYEKQYRKYEKKNCSCFEEE